MIRYNQSSDSVTDDQLAAMKQAVGRVGQEPWLGGMSAALECCDRGWLSVEVLANGALNDRASVFYLITEPGAAVLGRERRRFRL